jgi:hypothetical protein
LHICINRCQTCAVHLDAFTAFAQRLFTQMEVDRHNGKAITFFAIPHLKLHISTIFCTTGTREECSGV